MEGHRRRQQQHQHTATPFYHVPQKSRREKLRYPAAEIDLRHPTTTATVNDCAGAGDKERNIINRPVYIGNPNYIQLFQHPMFANHSGVSLSLSPSSSSSQYAGTRRGSDVEESIRIAGPSRPSEPFTGYAAVLNSSRFLGPAQQMLKEMCSVGGGVLDGFGCGSAPDTLGFDSGNDGTIVGVKSRLISMLEEVIN